MPSRRRVMVIVNPAAGRVRSSRRRLDRVVAGLERRGCLVDVRHAGAASGDAERLAREAGPDVDIVAPPAATARSMRWQTGLPAATRAIPLAVLPFGTANAGARDRSSAGPDRLAELIASGRTQPAWPGQIGDRLFLTTASSGFDADIVAAVAPG